MIRIIRQRDLHVTAVVCVDQLADKVIALGAGPCTQLQRGQQLTGAIDRLITEDSREIKRAIPAGDVDIVRAAFRIGQAERGQRPTVGCGGVVSKFKCTLGHYLAPLSDSTCF